MRQLKITKSITNRESQSLDKYLQDIGREDLITAEQEVELARKIKAGDQLALEKLTRANLRFVVSVAKQYQNQGLTLPDLINEGNLGLIKAQWPVKGSVVEGYSPKDLRKGLSIKSNMGPDVRPAAPGTVVYAGDGLRGYGKLVIIKHSEILLSAYAHNDKILVKEGQSVKSTETISKLGSKETLYFEIRKDGYPVNPSSYIE